MTDEEYRKAMVEEMWQLVNESLQQKMEAYRRLVAEGKAAPPVYDFDDFILPEPDAVINSLK